MPVAVADPGLRFCDGSGLAGVAGDADPRVFRDECAKRVNSVTLLENRMLATWYGGTTAYPSPSIAKALQLCCVIWPQLSLPRWDVRALALSQQLGRATFLTPRGTWSRLRL